MNMTEFTTLTRKEFSCENSFQPGIFHCQMVNFSGIMAVIFAILGSIGNAILIRAIMKTPALRRHQPTKFIASLAVSDFLFCAIFLPAFAIRSFNRSIFLNQTFDYYWGYIKYGLLTVSLVHLVVIAINRYIVIFYPSFSEKIFTATKTKIMIVFIWIFGYAVLLQFITTSSKVEFTCLTYGSISTSQRTHL